MIELTYDRDARMLYTYFAEFAEGEDATQIEVDGAFLLDGDGQLLGFRFETAGVLLPQALRYAAGSDGVVLGADGNLSVRFVAQPPAAEEPFPFPAIWDLDRKGNALGAEVAAEPEWNLHARLAVARPLIVEEFGADDEEGEPDDAARAEQLPEPLADAVPLAPGDEQSSADPANVAIGGEFGAYAGIDSGVLVRSGFVALVGRPNVGKSTLLNAYLGHKVSIVSPKPQTTRVAIRGMLQRPDAQIIFVDTPGLHTPKSGLGAYMVEAARRAIPDSDVLCFVVDAADPPGKLDREIAELVKRAHKPAILVLNKVDIARKADVWLPQYRELGPWDMEVAVSAKTGDGLETLLDEIVGRLPEGPRLFPAEQTTDRSEREQVAELIREKVLLNTQEEVPHGAAVEIEEWEQRGRRLYIRATVNVERDGHKGIVIGEGGRMLKKIGAAARFEIERLLGRPVFLDLWVKVRKDWRSDPASLRWLGYDVRDLRK